MAKEKKIDILKLKKEELLDLINSNKKELSKIYLVKSDSVDLNSKRRLKKEIATYYTRLNQIGMNNG